MGKTRSTGETSKKGKLTDEWATPQWLFDQLNDIYGPFDIDVCASNKNSKCTVFFDEADDGLTSSWIGKTWLNPPYSDPSPWVEKAVNETRMGVTIGALLPADHSVKWYNKFIANNPCAKIVERFPYRIKFNPPKDWTGNISGPRGSHIFVLFTPQVIRAQQLEVFIGSRTDEANPAKSRSNRATTIPE